MTESHDQTLTPTPGQISRGCHSVVDMLPDVARDWQPWLAAEQAYDPEKGVSRASSGICRSSPCVCLRRRRAVGTDLTASRRWRSERAAARPEHPVHRAGTVGHTVP